jgi:hypothetical protein
VGNQAQRGCSALDGQSRFVDAGDAADFYSGRALRFHGFIESVKHFFIESLKARWDAMFQ